MFIVALIQYVYVMNDSLAHSSFPFLDGVPTPVSYPHLVSYLVGWYISIAASSFILLGHISDSLLDYGKYIILRGKSRISWLMSKAIHMWRVVLILVFSQLIVTTFFQTTLDSNPVLELTHPFEGILFYVLTIMAILSIQMILELHMKSQLAFILTNCYVLLSITIVEGFSQKKVLFHVFFPNLSMGFRNGMIANPTLQEIIGPFNELWLFLVVMILFLLCLSVIRIKKIELM
ncbi:DUF2705 family protein [Peribacillus muralis]|uniref:DUF2705 family protein n=1 Tax=Peribacillus muralis TaxID=264697 RepID=UPI00137998A5|nr:DUF2705 family protein [Peribacillus muralis]